MQTLVLSALSASPRPDPGPESLLRDEVARRGWPVESVDLSDLRVLHCRGCSGCSTRTPGRCVINDDLRTLLPRIVASGLLVLATPILYGGHHPLLKQVVDRFLPLSTPTWVRRAGELHSRMRYARRPALLGLGLLAPDADGGEADTFALLVARHAVNLDLPRHEAVVTTPGPGSDLPRRLAAALDRLEVRP